MAVDCFWCRRRGTLKVSLIGWMIKNAIIDKPYSYRRCNDKRCQNLDRYPLNKPHSNPQHLDYQSGDWTEMSCDSSLNAQSVFLLGWFWKRLIVIYIKWNSEQRNLQSISIPENHSEIASIQLEETEIQALFTVMIGPGNHRVSVIVPLNFIKIRIVRVISNVHGIPLRTSWSCPDHTNG